MSLCPYHYRKKSFGSGDFLADEYCCYGGVYANCSLAVFLFPMTISTTIATFKMCQLTFIGSNLLSFMLDFKSSSSRARSSLPHLYFAYRPLAKSKDDARLWRFQLPSCFVEHVFEQRRGSQPLSDRWHGIYVAPSFPVASSPIISSTLSCLCSTSSVCALMLSSWR